MSPASERGAPRRRGRGVALSTRSPTNELRRIHERLRESERRLTEVQQVARLGSWEWDIVRDRVVWSQQLYRLFGLAPRRLAFSYGDYLARVHVEDRTRTRDLVDTALRTRAAFAFDHRVVWPDSSVHWLHGRGRVITDNGRATRMVGTAQDITDRKRAEDERDRFFTLSVDMMVVAGLDGRLKRWNPAFEAAVGLGPAGLAGRKYYELIHPDDQAAVDLLNELRENTRPLRVEGRLRGRDGGYRWTAWQVVPDPDQGLVYGVGHDVTEQRQAGEALLSSREEFARLAAHLQRIREEERAHIAREIHDELGQALTALKMELAAVEAGLKATRSRFQARARAGMIQVDAMIRAVQRIATSLRPGVLDDLGLVPALEWLVRDVESRSGIRCRFATDLERLDLGPEAEAQVFRLCQEALTNVVRHSGASRAEVVLARADGGPLVLQVRDDGRGLPAEAGRAPRSLGLGLLGMRERARLLGGAIEFDGAPGAGTVVTVRWPWPDPRSGPS